MVDVSCSPPSAASSASGGGDVAGSSGVSAHLLAPSPRLSCSSLARPLLNVIDTQGVVSIEEPKLSSTCFGLLECRAADTRANPSPSAFQRHPAPPTTSCHENRIRNKTSRPGWCPPLVVQIQIIHRLVSPPSHHFDIRIVAKGPKPCARRVRKPFGAFQAHHESVVHVSHIWHPLFFTGRLVGLLFPQ